ncbi:MAG TPA: sulfatase-like hydrolase/transferase [Actinomycetota bacterium]
MQRTPRLVLFVTFVTLVALAAPQASAADLAPPNGLFTAPTQGQVLTANPVTLRGTATDDVGISAVHVAIRNTTTSRWLRADGTWGTAQVWLPTTLASPRARSTTWSYTFTATTGTYSTTVRARDTSWKIDPTRPWRGFSVSLTPPPPPPPPPTGKPNVVLILTDDQRFDTLWAMPNVQSLLVNHGVTFTNGIVANALCCPSRANILKGAYSHTTRVYQNSGTYGPFGAGFSDSSTVGTWMDGAGYRTAFVGKYFNFYEQNRGASYVPPGWDRWVAFATDDVGGGRYYDYGLSVDGTRLAYGSTTADYSTDVLAGYAESFVRSTPAAEPLFLMFTPYAPHEPADAAPRHTSTFSSLAPWRPPSYDEPDVSDKPSYIRAIPRFGSTNTARIDSIRRKQYQSLQAVDDAVARLVTALQETGRLSNTMIVFTSDNGFLWGEHRWGRNGPENKQVPYEESIRVPYVVRYDPLVTAPRTDPSLVLNIDLAPTFTALAGVPAPGAEGRSFLPLLQTPGSPWRTDLLIEHYLSNVPTYCAVRTTDSIYVRYGTGEQELYLLGTDPYELVNQAANPAYASLVASLRARAQELCVPTPPGYSFSSVVSVLLRDDTPTI